MPTKGGRGRRARLLRVHESKIADEARAAGPEEVVVAADPHSEARFLTALEPDDKALDGRVGAALRMETPIVVFRVDSKRLARVTLGRWPKLSERYAVKAPDGEVWGLVVANGGATLASFSRDADGGGPAVVLELDGGRR